MILKKFLKNHRELFVVFVKRAFIIIISNCTLKLVKIMIIMTVYQIEVNFQRKIH